MRGVRLVGALLIMAGLLQAVLSLKIAAFNIRSFGETKISNATLARYIVQIVNRYDIVVIQEVRDSHLTAVGKLLDNLNEPDQVSVLDSYQYDDGCEPCGNDTFSREPAVVKFSSPNTRVKEFAIAPLHAAPSDAVPEIDALYDVYLDIRRRWDMEDIMFMGDFNAGCSYVGTSQWSSIRLRTDPAFLWLIPDSADTTVTTTHCAYDRIVVAGELLQDAIVPGSARPFDFEVAYGLSNDLALAISDHYPVEVTLKRD